MAMQKTKQPKKQVTAKAKTEAERLKKVPGVRTKAPRSAAWKKHHKAKNLASKRNKARIAANEERQRDREAAEKLRAEQEAAEKAAMLATAEPTIAPAEITETILAADPAPVVTLDTVEPEVE